MTQSVKEIGSRAVSAMTAVVTKVVDVGNSVKSVSVLSKRDRDEQVSTHRFQPLQFDANI